MAFKGHGSFISGVTDAVWQSALGLVRGVGVKRARSAALAHRFYDGLVEALEVNLILILYLNRKTQLISVSLLRLLSQPDVQTLSLR